MNFDRRKFLATTMGTLCTRCTLGAGGERNPKPRVCTTVDLLPAQNRYEQDANGPSVSDGLESSKFELGAECAELWRPGQVVRVRFLGGDPVVQARIIKVANEWTRYANVRFDFGDYRKSDVRISLEKDESSWSEIGRKSGRISKRQATMHFGWFDQNTDEKELRRTTLHEFGHALGFVHELQSPVAGIPWDRDRVYEFYAKEGWTKDETDQNVLDKYVGTKTNFSAFDPKSIMCYPVEKDLTLGGFSIGWNSELSEMDKKYCRKWYPPKVERKRWRSESGEMRFMLVGGKNWQLIYSSGRKTDMITVSSDDRVIELATPSGKYRARLFSTEYEWKSPGTAWTNAGEGSWEVLHA